LNDFNFKTENLKLKICEDTLAVIAVHLFGIPENIFNLRELTKKEGVVLIEDAAQAFGNKIFLNSFSLNTHNLPFNTNQYLGSFGDIGIFSFGRGKPLSFLNGGAVLVNDEKYHKTVQEFHSSLSGSNHSPPTVLYFFNLLIYSIFYHPNLYWIPNNVPWLKLGETIFSLDFEIGRLNPNALRIGRALIKNFEKIREKREQIARAYRDRLKNIQEEFVYIPERDEENISLLRFPIVFKSKEKRDRILLELKKRGLGATGMYPVPLNEQEGIPGNLFKEEGKLYPNAKHHSDRILTLPLHEYVRIKDIEIIYRVIEKHLKN
jgi:dTDP-4-amino-4,6-dideoxygalactose transaminase